MQVGFAGVRWTEDAGRPPETDFREQKVSNRPVLLRSKGAMVSDCVKVVHRGWQVRSGKMTVSDLIAQNLLRAVFQPIFRFADGDVFGYEALIRGPRGSPLESPLALLAAAGREGLSIEFERKAARLCLERFIELKLPGRIFLNYSATALTALVQDWQQVLPRLKAYGFAFERIVVELTERVWIANPEQFTASVSLIRQCGVGFAMDDYGTAQSSLSLWVALRPEFVKIDKYFITNVAKDPIKYEALRSVMRFAFSTQTKLIAEGVESEEDMKVVRDLSGRGFSLRAQPRFRLSTCPPMRV